MTTIQIKVPKCLDLIIVWPILLYRRLRFGHPFRKIPLGQNLFAVVDPADYYWLNQFHWSLKRDRKYFYAVRFLNETGGKNKIISMHREIMNFPKGLLVDHRNGDPLDNRRDNLRLATRSQNQYNRAKTYLKTTSRFIGVNFDKKRCGLWVARIRCNGKSIFLGRFESETDAAKAYDEAAKKYHGEFARLNFTP